MSKLIENLQTIKTEKETNLLPENLRSGVTLFNITGELEEGIDTSDGTATESNIDKGYIAYAKDVKIVGTGKVLDGTVDPIMLPDGSVISLSEYIPLVKSDISSYRKAGSAILFPTSKLPVDVTGKNIMLRWDPFRANYSGATVYYATAYLCIAPSLDCHFEVRRDSSQDLIRCWNADNTGRVNFQSYRYSLYLGDSKQITVNPGTIDNITAESWEDRGSMYSDGSEYTNNNWYAFVTNKMYNSGGLAQGRQYSERGDDCFVSIKLSGDVPQYRLKSGGTVLCRVQDENIVEAINLTPDKIVKGNKFFGVEGTYKDKIEIEPSNSSRLSIPEIITSIDFTGMDLSKYTSTVNIFSGYTKLKSVTNLNTYLATNMYGTFNGCTNLTTIVDINTSSAVNMYGMFNRCANLCNISGLDTSNCTYMGSMFYGCSSLAELPNMNTSKVTGMAQICSSCLNITSVSLDCSSCTDLQNAFNQCVNLREINLTNTGKVKNMLGTFAFCNLLEIGPELNTSSVINMQYMFGGSPNLSVVPLYDTSNVTCMSTMLHGTNITDIPAFNTNKVTIMGQFAMGCPNLINVPILNLASTTNAYSMFSGCPNLSEDSLNNILAMCINATKISTSNRTLKHFGLTSNQANVCINLSNYQAFIDAGWTTGY